MRPPVPIGFTAPPLLQFVVKPWSAKPALKFIVCCPSPAMEYKVGIPFSEPLNSSFTLNRECTS